jgi:hypothetical protein
MINRNFIIKAIQDVRTDLPLVEVNKLVEDAQRVLGNLVHYKHGGTHEDSDIATLALTLAAQNRIPEREALLLHALNCPACFCFLGHLDADGKQNPFVVARHARTCTMLAVYEHMERQL